MTVPQQEHVSGLSGERFRVVYEIGGGEDEARSTATIVANEQTVEFLDEFVPAGDIRNEVMGRVEDLTAAGDGLWHATISYEVGSAGADLPQLINMLNGLTSFLPDLKAQRVELPAELSRRFAGPAHGISGIRDRLGVYDRPLLCTALKPMGLSIESLSTMAYEAAFGGLDILKDDHGITDLPFAPFEQRVERLAAAVSEANAKTGFKCLYAANVTAATDRIIDRALFAQEAGAGMLMVAPAITGFDTMRMLADDPRVKLPILSHPTVAGGHVVGQGAPFSFYLYFGQMHRLAGADATIYANYGGRFPVSVDDSHGAVSGCRDEFGGLRPTLPMIGGGMTIERGAQLREEFGVDSGFLVGGRLHSKEDNLTERVKRFVETVS